METTEKIVEAYVRYVKGWLTIANVKCDGQMELDLLAVDVSQRNRVKRYHRKWRLDLGVLLPSDEQAVLHR